jgi:hypothetical protein
MYGHGDKKCGYSELREGARRKKYWFSPTRIHDTTTQMTTTFTLIAVKTWKLTNFLLSDMFRSVCYTLYR